MPRRAGAAKVHGVSKEGATSSTICCRSRRMVTNMLQSHLTLGDVCLRRMCMFRHHPGKTFVENVRDFTHLARKWFHKRGHKSIATLLLERQHKLIGASFARLAVAIGSKVADQEPENLVAWPYPGDIKARKPSVSVVALSLSWKSQAWWTDEQSVIAVIDATNVSGQRHTQPGRQCLWERHFVKFLVSIGCGLR